MLKDNILTIKEKIKIAALAANRRTEDIKLIAVSKTHGAEKVKEAILAGQLIFGENYIQEAKAKISQLRADDQGKEVEFHFIGHLQRNKAKDAVDLFSLIQTVDKIELASEIDKYAKKKEIKQRVLMQINISDESSKSGVGPEDSISLAKKILEFENLKLEGLMCIGRYFEEALPDSVRREEFRKMKELKVYLEKLLSFELPELSMGMSHDFDLAIAEGSTMIRVGSAIFGERQ